MQSAYALQAPDDDTLASFLGALPMMFSIAILSPHGFFGQSGGCLWAYCSRICLRAMEQNGV
jgi:Sucrose synthase